MLGCMGLTLTATSQKTFAQSLRVNGLRPTKQRACVYSVILEKKDHPTADDIFDRVKKTPSRHLFCHGIQLFRNIGCLRTS